MGELRATSGKRVAGRIITGPTEEMREVGHLIGRVINNIDDESVIAEVSEEVVRLTDAHPIYE
ncbi:hypothetical protein [Halodesulfurarchaeum sp.]|uniref:hypothetical protein n=1 Tax=Halodesulfurarchaeum sp. TaxID=1980530 RepID=UPI001BB823AB|nr:hypothetical protein [Halodesulfurarchaeum sp.]